MRSRATASAFLRGPDECRRSIPVPSIDVRPFVNKKPRYGLAAFLCGLEEVHRSLFALSLDGHSARLNIMFPIADQIHNRGFVHIHRGLGKMLWELAKRPAAAAARRRWNIGGGTEAGG